MALKIKNRDQALEMKSKLKAEKETAEGELKAFRSENKIKKEAKVEEVDKALRGTYKKLKATYKGIKDNLQAVNDYLAENKAAKEKKPRVAKYDYPAGMSSEDKKKFRAKARAEAARKLKGESGGGKKKSAKKEEKSSGKKSAKKGVAQKASSNKKKIKKVKSESQAAETQAASSED